MTHVHHMIRVALNGTEVSVDAHPGRRLSDVLREDLGLHGTKVGCDAGDCGACTVLVDGAPVCACLTPVGRVRDRAVTTIEGISAKGLTDLQQAFLRQGAAQCGICTPGMVVAAAALLARRPRPTRDEVEDAIGGVLCRCTGYARIVDAVLEAADRRAAPALPESGAAVGAAVERLDGQPKVDGSEVFGADHWPLEALVVRAVRSPHFAARFTLGDVQGWATARGLRVLTAADIPGTNRFSAIPAFADQPALAEGEVRYRGEPVALVVGEGQAMDDLDLTDFPVTWDPIDPILGLDAATGGRAVLAERPDNVLTRGRVVTGDATAGLAAAAHRARAEVQTAYVEHAYIEPEAGVAWLDGDTLVIQACTQAPVMDRDETAGVLGLPVDRVRIIPSATGGGFGSKLDLSVQPLIGLAVLKTGRPCRMVYSRTESMQSTTKRHPARMTAEIGCDASGRITGMAFQGQFDTGAYSSWGPTVANRVPVHASGPYRVPAYRAETVALHTNGPVSGAFRGFGVPQAAVIQELLFDDLALAAGIDRLAFRRINALAEGDRSVCGQQMRGVGIGACLDALQPRWAEARDEAARASARGGPRRRGIGVASCWYGCGNTALPNPSTIRAGITPAGRLMLHQGATDIGQGSNTVIAQIFADAMGIALADVALIGPDTAITPDCGKTSASRQTVVTGNAALRAGRALRAEILRRANRAEDAQIRLGPGRVTVADAEGSTTLDLSVLPAQADGYVLSAQETYDPPTLPLDENGQGAPYAVYGYGAQLAEVEVDMELGTVRVLRITAAHDLGRVINPGLARGQIEGGIAQGLGMALMEEYIPGRTENLHDYLIPTAGDMPVIDPILIEVPDPEGPLGAKGLGEHVLIPTAPAILSAIRDASGARITRLPALPHRVLAAIRAARA